MSSELLLAIRERYGLSLVQEKQLDGGDECLIWSAVSPQGPLVVRVSPPWRSPERLLWIHSLLLSFHIAFPQVIAPLRARDGSTLFSYNHQSVALFPYIIGTPLDRENPSLREQTAMFLAHLHRELLQRTSASPDLQRDLLPGAPPLPSVPDPVVLVDPELDTWHMTLLEDHAGFCTGLIHGDYYRRNLLTQKGSIVALLDWDDLHSDFLMQEVAWASWEFCKTSAGDDWHLDRALAFLRNYHAAGGPCALEEYATCIPFIRWRLRQELRRHFAAVASYLPGEPEYAAGLLRAFERLRNCNLKFI